MRKLTDFGFQIADSYCHPQSITILFYMQKNLELFYKITENDKCLRLVINRLKKRKYLTSDCIQLELVKIAAHHNFWIDGVPCFNTILNKYKMLNIILILIQY